MYLQNCNLYDSFMKFGTQARRMGAVFVCGLCMIVKQRDFENFYNYKGKRQVSNEKSIIS